MRNTLFAFLLFDAAFLTHSRDWTTAENSFLSGRTTAYGTITFDGQGRYRVAGQITDSVNAPGTARSFTPTGSYVVSSSGMAEIESPIYPRDVLYPGVGAGAVVVERGKVLHIRVWLR